MAEHAAETFRKGDRVVMIGRLESSPREDEKTGFKYTKHSVLVDGLGPDVRFATAKVSKVAKAEGSGSAASSRPARDAQAEASGASYGDEEPF
jgi:single-strand DNA-binding protein